MQETEVYKERHFVPYHYLLAIARIAVEQIEKKETGWYYSQIVAMTFSALAVEAIGNSFGNEFISNWRDFESTSPIGKIRILCEHFKISYDKNSDPWKFLPFLFKFRNKIAHAKPENVIDTFTIHNNDIFEATKNPPKSKIDNLLSPINAKKSLDCAIDIKFILCNCLPLEKLKNFLSDGHTGGTR